MGPPHQPPPLPVDPLLEIVARCDDAKSVIRCAAVSRPLRRAILDPGFRRRLGLRAAANGGFDPDLLMGVSFSLRSPSLGDHFQQAARHLRFDTDLLRSFELVSSRDGLLVLRRNQEGVELLVCNSITGHVSSLPKPGGSYICRPAFLSTGRSFELLVMYYRDSGIRPVTQIFSSEKAKWGAAHRIHLPQGVHPAVEATTTAPAVIGSNVHWLCSNIPDPFSLGVSDLFILALHADAEQATVIRLPKDLPTSMMSGRCNSSSSYAHSMILAATEGGKSLSLIVAEKVAIAVWTLLPDEGTTISSWSRQVVIRRGEIGRQLTSVMDAYQNIRFEVFGERSGTVVFWVRMGGLVQLNLGTKKAVVLWKGRDYNYLESRSFLSEVDLVSLLRVGVYGLKAVGGKKTKKKY